MVHCTAFGCTNSWWKCEKNNNETITIHKQVIEDSSAEYINIFILEFINSYTKEISLDFYLGDLTKHRYCFFPDIQLQIMSVRPI